MVLLFPFIQKTKNNFWGVFFPPHLEILTLYLMSNLKVFSIGDITTKHFFFFRYIKTQIILLSNFHMICSRCVLCFVFICRSMIITLKFDWHCRTGTHLQYDHNQGCTLLTLLVIGSFDPTFHSFPNTHTLHPARVRGRFLQSITHHVAGAHLATFLLFSSRTWYSSGLVFAQIAYTWWTRE